ncbi:MAG TPA: efflux RND transporter periplasmic adaptor subunit, partial [Pirellulales bacterium]|nr:efflux RND transporter periplasmic adaptor subunit [Pirellulales bacterium]
MTVWKRFAKRGTIGIAIVAVVVAFGTLEFGHLRTQAEPAEQGESSDSGQSRTRVETVHPHNGGLAHTTVQPGSARSYESADLYAKVSGYLETQDVDIGSRVKRGQLLAQIDVPELTKDYELAQAALDQAKSEIEQMKARIDSAVAEKNAAQAYVAQTEADLQRCAAERSFREKQYNRIRDLHEMKSVEERLVDEKLDQLHAADAADRAAHSAVTTAQQQVAAAEARVESARADLRVSEAKVRVAEATVGKAKVMVSYTQITSPYDGVVTHRNFHRGAFIRAPDQGGQIPLLTVDRTDLMRIVVQIPDREVPFAQPGDPATIRFDALPRTPFKGRIARIAESENDETRTMRVEIDLPNPNGVVRDAMYGRVEILLEPAHGGVTIPSACFMGNIEDSRGQVFIVHNGRVSLKSVVIGSDNGTLAEVVSGLSPGDEVVMRPPGSLADGAEVVASASH